MHLKTYLLSCAPARQPLQTLRLTHAVPFHSFHPLQAILEAVDNGGGVANTRAAGVVGSNMAWAAGELQQHRLGSAFTES
jgi:hypothetical protein